MTDLAHPPTPFQPAKLTAVDGLAVVPPIIGRVCTGHSVKRTTAKGVRTLPMQDHAFHVTSLVQTDDLTWAPHPIEATLLEASAAHDTPKERPSALTRIPVRIAYDALDLNLQNRFVTYDGKGSPTCIGDGCRARRLIDGCMQDIDCPRPERCHFGREARCRNFSRVLIRIEGQTDALGVFALRTASYNTTQYVGARLLQLHSGLQGRIAGIPMDLVIRQKTSAASFGQAFSFVDLVEREGVPLAKAIEMGRAWRENFHAMGFSLETMEAGLSAALARSRYALQDDDLEDPAEWFSEPDDAAPEGAAQDMRGLNAFVQKELPETCPSTESAVPVSVTPEPQSEAARAETVAAPLNDAAPPATSQPKRTAPARVQPVRTPTLPVSERSSVQLTSPSRTTRPVAQVRSPRPAGAVPAKSPLF